MLLYITHESSQDLYPDNTHTDFTYELPKELLLEGQWYCNLKDVVMNRDIADIFCLYCDIIEPCSALGQTKQLLRVFRNMILPTPQYHALKTHYVQRINFKLRLDTDQCPKLKTIRIVYVLELTDTPYK